jgi:serine-type D-Ala-D-Ala carboxypeptidase/endopeptidase (penicillin-binding protein 4)
MKSHKTRLVVQSILVSALFIVLLLSLRPLIAGPAKEDDKQAQKPKILNTSEITNPDLSALLDKMIDENQIGSARLGVSVISLQGKVVYQHNADKLFTPASNMKIYTTGVALDLLGPDYRWKTSVYAAAAPDARGTVNGDLILYGRGAPDLVSDSKDDNRSSLAKLANDLYERGLRNINGNIVGDESYFRGDPLGDGWQWNDVQWYFGAEASALSINGNEVEVNAVPSTKAGEPPTIRTSDPTGYVTVQNRMASVERDGRPTIGVHRDLSGNDVEIWGEFPPGAKGFGARLSVHNPALWAAKLFVSALKSRGITVSGQAASRNSRVPQSERFNPAQATELASVLSLPLSEIARRTNKLSINLYAELILRTLGRERGEMLTQPEPVGRERGDDEAGLEVMRLWLMRAGIPTNDLALHDGSGLSRLDLVTPNSAARLLLSLSQRAADAAFRQSLPIAGQDGTLGGRLKAVAGRVVAKTGYITYDNSLSGYVTNSRNEILAFSIMSNDRTGHGESTGLIDEIASLLANFPDVPAKKTQNP